MQQFNAVDAQTQAKWRNPSKMATIERGETKRVLCVCFATKQFMSLQNSSKQFMSVYVLSMGPHCSLHHCSLHQVTKHLRVKKLPTRAATSGMKCKKTPPVPAKPPVWPFASRMGKVASNVPKPRRPYKSMDQAKLVKKHGEMHQKLQLAQKRMENVKTKFDRFDAERKLRATVATHDENAQAASDTKSDTKSDTASDSGSGSEMDEDKVDYHDAPKLDRNTDLVQLALPRSKTIECPSVNQAVNCLRFV